MNIKSLLLLPALCFATLVARPATARAEVSFDFFFDALAPHGDWIDVGGYGSCWRPRGVGADWRPYSDGYWSYTDGGWTWVSYEDFGGIVYHYGRWADVDGEGWCWVPDSQWAPAWVSWRSNDDYIGWAPLPPEARWRRDTGFSVWVDSFYDIGPSRFNFCRIQDFGAPFLQPVIVSHFANIAIIQQTTNVTNISYFDGGGFGGLVHCGGPGFAFVNQHVFQPIPALRLIQNTNITNIDIRNVNVFNAAPRGNQLTVLAPQIAPPTAEMRAPRPVRSIPAARITKGWDGVKDPAVAEGIRTRMRQDSRGLTPESAPARRVQAAEMKVLPAQADPNAPSPLRTGRERTIGSRKVESPATAPTPTVEKVDPARPVDARTAERLAREKARTATGQPPAATAPPSADPRRAVAPATSEKPVAEKAREPMERSAQPERSEKDSRGRQITRSNPPAAAPASPVEKKPEPTDRSRSATVPAPMGEDRSARARAESAVRERAMEEQRARAVAGERQRAAEETLRRPPAPSDTSRRPMPAEAQQRPQPAEAPRVKTNDDGARKAAEAAGRQRQIDSARQQQMDGARREQVQESARRSQMDAARRDQAVESARSQQMDAARREQATQAARGQQMEAARRQPAAAPVQAARPQPRAEAPRREMPAARQPAPRSVPPPQPARSESRESRSKEQPSASDLEALRKARGR